MISPTGIWGEEEQHAHIFSFGIANWIANNIQGAFFDFGAGNGAYSQFLKDRAYNVLAYDGYPQGIVVGLDLAKSFYLDEKRNVLCLEVFEHIPKEFEGIFLSNIERHCQGTLIISVAVPGQDGIGHLNCQSNIYVIDRLQHLGFKLNTKQTLEIRSVVEDNVSYFRNTLLVFDK